ncbi:MAG TPA: hypothetical protein VHT73_05580, partial [Thermodesulfobacteriota bacterium]|nr:hypothetical protein [Thermodesulfobacteriota bacterium]
MNKIKQRAKKGKKTSPKKKTKPKDAAPEGQGEHANPIPPFTPPPYPILGKILVDEPLYSERFLSYVKEYWLQNPLLPLSLDQLYAMFRSLEKFQQTKNPEFLGRAISFNPVLLEIDLIRTKIVKWMLAPSITDKVE